MEDHPTAEDFRSLLQQSSKPVSRERNATAVRHLLAGCDVCRFTIQSLRGARTLLERLFEIPISSPTPARPADQSKYDWAFARAERALAQHLARRSPSKSLPERLSELDRLSDGEQVRRVSASVRFSEPELIECLLDRSHATRYDSPRKTLHFSLLARLASEHCSLESAGGEDKVADLQARTWGAFANAQRICGDLSSAEEAFGIAFQKWEQGTRSALVQADLSSKLGSLRLSQRRFEEANKLITTAEHIYHESGALNFYHATLVQKSLALIVAGNARLAAPLLLRSLSVINGEEDPLLLLLARHNLLFCHIELDQPDEALAVHVESRDLYQKCKDSLLLLRAIWQEGTLLAQIGHLHNAEAALLRARQGFIEQDLAYEAAMVSLDLAEIYRKLRRFEDLRKTLSEALPIFRSLQVSREVLASLLRLQQAIAEEDSGG